MCSLFVNRFWAFCLLAFLGSLLWAHSRDPFRRNEFVVQTASGAKIRCMGVFPAGTTHSPLAIFIPGSSRTLHNDGYILRQFAELGMAAVEPEYDEAHAIPDAEKFPALFTYLHEQSWLDANKIAWIDISRNAAATTKYVLENPHYPSAIRVVIVSDWAPDFRKTIVSIRLHSGSLAFSNIALLPNQVNGPLVGLDERHVKETLRASSIPLTIGILPTHNQGVNLYSAEVCRLIAEYCKGKLTPNQPLPCFPVLRPYPFVLCVSPMAAWLGMCYYFRSRLTSSRKVSITSSESARSRKTRMGWQLATFLLGVLAVVDTALHLMPPQMQITTGTLALAKNYLIDPKYQKDFEALAVLSIWHGQKLGTLLDNVNLAEYTVDELVKWKVRETLFREFVLSPVIIGDDIQVNWRRNLWENFYPRARQESSTANAAAVVVRFLRRRVTIDPHFENQIGVQAMWDRKIVNLSDFEIIYVAALRSIGIPARLNRWNEAEFWTGSQWAIGPRPLAISWVDN